MLRCIRYLSHTHTHSFFTVLLQQVIEFIPNQSDGPWRFELYLWELHIRLLKILTVSTYTGFYYDSQEM